MTKGIDTTIQLLSRSKNRAALRLLEQALKSSDENVRRLAGKQLIASRSAKSIAELIRNFDPGDANLIEIFQDNREKLIPGLRAAISGEDKALARNAFRIIYTQRFFEVLPQLIALFMDQSKHTEAGSSLGDTILKLTDKFTQALEERKNRRHLYGTVLPEVLKTIEPGLKDFHRNDPLLVLHVLIYLYPYIPPEHQEIAQVLQSTSSPVYMTSFRLLSTDESPHIRQFIISRLDDLEPLQIALSAFAKRKDIPFLHTLFQKTCEHIPFDMRTNLSRIQKVEWLDSIPDLLGSFSETDQVGMVAVLMALNLPARDLEDRLIEIFQNGRGEGRRSALSELGRIAGLRINQLIFNAAEDADPKVQIIALKLLAQRRPPKASLRILQFAGSPNPDVRATVQSLLPEFHFSRFMESFDLLSDEQRRTMFSLVRQVDQNTVDEIAKILFLDSPADKHKALLCIEYGNLVPQLEDSLCGVLSKGETAELRVQAARLLATGNRELSRSTLVQALHRDASPEVREAARASLEQRPTHWGGPK